MIFGDAVGWCEGIIKAVNTDARKIITRGEPANFFVYYQSTTTRPSTT